MQKSGFTSSPFVLSAISILGVIGAAVAGIAAPWAVIAAPIISGIYTLANAWVKSSQPPSVDDAVQTAVKAALDAYHASQPKAAPAPAFDANSFGGMTASEATAAKKVTDPTVLAALQATADQAATALAKAQAELVAAQAK